MESENPYAPPRAPLIDPASGDAPLFAVPAAKLIVLSFATLGLYDTWWCYRNWQRIRARTARPLSPFWRAVFSPLWGFSLLPEIEREGRAVGLASAIPPVPCAIVFLVLSGLWRLPDPYWLVSMLSFVPLLPANATAGRVVAALAPGFRPEHAWSSWNIAGALLGLVLWGLILAGMALPES